MPWLIQLGYSAKTMYNTITAPPHQLFRLRLKMSVEHTVMMVMDLLDQALTMESALVWLFFRNLGSARKRLGFNCGSWHQLSTKPEMHTTQYGIASLIVPEHYVVPLTEQMRGRDPIKN